MKEETGEIAKVEAEPKLEGRQMIMVLAALGAIAQNLGNLLADFPVRGVHAQVYCEISGLSPANLSS